MYKRSSLSARPEGEIHGLYFEIHDYFLTTQDL